MPKITCNYCHKEITKKSDFQLGSNLDAYVGKGNYGTFFGIPDTPYHQLCYVDHSEKVAKDMSGDGPLHADIITRGAAGRQMVMGRFYSPVGLFNMWIILGVIFGYLFLQNILRGHSLSEPIVIVEFVILLIALLLKSRVIHTYEQHLT